MLLNVILGQKLIAQSCPIYDGFKAIEIQYVFNGTVTNACFPFIGGDASGVRGYLFNCFSVWNEATGQIENFTGGNGFGDKGIYGEEFPVPYCQCILQGPFFRVVYNILPTCNYNCPPFFQNSTTIGFVHLIKSESRNSLLLKIRVISSRVAFLFGSSIARNAEFLKY